MSMSITMLQTRMGEAGSLLVSGNTYTVSDAFGAEMVGKRFASDTNGVLNPQARGNFTAAEYAALISAVAAGTSTYSATEIDNRAGVPPILALRDALEIGNWARGYIVDGSSSVKPSTGKVVSAAATFAAPWATPTNPSGNLMRIIQSTPSAHGMGAGSDGKMLYVATSAGVPSGFYTISTRASANQVDVDVGAANQSLIATTVITDVSRVGVNWPGAIVGPIPGGIMGPNGSAQFQTMWECNNSAGAKNMSVMVGTSSAGVGGSQLSGTLQLTTANGYNPLAGWTLWNMNSQAVQRGMSPAASQTAAATAHTIDTSVDWYALLRFNTAVVDDWIDVLRWRAEVRPAV